MANLLENSRVDVNNFFGFNNTEFKNGLYKLAISEPSKYFDLRAKVYKELKKKMATQLYEQIFDLMVKGEIDKVGIFGQSSIPPPRMPVQKVNNFALSSVATLDEIYNHLIEELLPIDFNRIMQSKFAKEGLAENPQA